NDAGLGSFRTAVSLANGAAGLDTIRFATPGSINLLSPMAAFTSPVFIDGASTPGYISCGPPTTIINGAGAGAANGLQFLFGASGSTILAINVQNFQLNGIQFIDCDAATIRGCFVGLNATGTAAAANSLNGIQLENGSDFCTIGGPTPCDGNALSGNGQSGVSANASSSLTVSGNLIGTNATGMGAVGNGGIGVLITNGSNMATIGGSIQTERNIISNNGTGLGGNGIDVGNSSDCVIRNNLVGLDITGAIPMGNAENGIAVNAANNITIGGTGTFDGNVIANHNFHAIVLNGGSNNSTVQGNFCGTNAAGTAAIGNDDSGVIVINTSGVQIGGTVPGARNILSGSLSEYGIFVISSDNVVIEGNAIGTDITGTNPLPNADGGVRLDFNANQNTVGGSAPGAGNLIAHNNGYGVGILSANCARNMVSNNTMFCNTGLGIDLNGLGNNNHLTPTISALSLSGISGTAFGLDEVQIYYDSTCTATCQGNRLIATVNADAAGNWSYVGPIANNSTVAVVGIRTAAPITLTNNTSEFVCQQVVVTPVEWASFEAEALPGQGVQLDWATASEMHAKHFEVERSLDGNSYETVGLVPAANAADGHAYDFIDPVTAEGIYYYRLRQVDLDGAFDYSETRQVLVGEGAVALDLAQNPSNAEIRFRVQQPDVKALECILLDASGKIVMQRSVDGYAQGWIEMPAEQLPAGMYFLNVQSKDTRWSEKVLIQH
ncbi:MAG: T9SS type A sorting domain-containing protein, partial [Bacteroidota bacterium]